MRIARRAAAWVRQPERSNLLALRVMSWISLHLGRRAGRLLLPPISAWFVLFAPQARRASRDYLRRIFGREPRLGEIARHVHHFAATIHDRIYLLNERFDLFQIEVVGESLLSPVLQSGRGALLFGAHLGSFEVVRALGRQHPELHIVLTMFEDNARRISGVLAAINPAARPEIIPLGRVDTMLRVRDALAAGTLVGLLADRSPAAEERCSTALLGSPVTIPSGPFRLAAMLRQPVFFMAGLYLGGNRYRIHFAPIADFTDTAREARPAAIAAAIASYAACLEECCHAAPYNWFNFFDFCAADAPPAAA